MRPYEMMVIIEPEVEDHKALVEELQEVVRNLGGEIGKVDVWGKKTLAYPIKKKTEGFYAVFQFKLDPSQVAELDRIMKLRSQVMRHMVVLNEN